MKILSLVAATIGIFLSTGCTIPADAGCVSDQECYAGRVCDNGACTGEVSLSSNNISPSNTTSMNNTVNNGGNNTVNNGGNNTVNNGGNNTMNNGNNANNLPTPTCGSSSECDDDLVCAWQDDRNRTCVQPWSCDIQSEVEFDFCFFEFACDVGPYFLECDFGDQDNGICFCQTPEGEGLEFEAPRDICLDPTDMINQNCGWSTPRF